MKIVLVGAGNTGTVLGKLIKNAGHEIIQVISRTTKSARELAEVLHCSYGSLEEPEYADGDLFIICLADYAMNNIENFRALRNKLIVHTAGSLPMNVLKPFTETFGVIYPLQSLSKYVETIPDIPILVDGNNEKTFNKLLRFAQTISPLTFRANDDERMYYHIAAIFSSNFSNHMFALAEIFCQRKKINFKHLHPIIEEMSKRVTLYSPFLTQTGPAIRNDTFTLAKHLAMLSKDEDLKYIYLKLTENIMKLHGKR